MEVEEEVEGENDEDEETKVELQKIMKQMLAKETRVYLLLEKSFCKAHLAQKLLFDLRVATTILLFMNESNNLN